MVGDRKDSALYVRNKHAACRRAGIRSVNFLFPEGVSQVRLGVFRIAYSVALLVWHHL